MYASEKFQTNAWVYEFCKNINTSKGKYPTHEIVHINQNVLTYNSKFKTHNELQNKIWCQTNAPYPLMRFEYQNVKMIFQCNSPRINLINTKNQDLIHNELSYQQMITRKKIFTINTLHPRPPIATSKE
jgi:hypothetical protein